MRRLRDAGAVLIGKTNLHEFALGTTSEESAYRRRAQPARPIALGRRLERRIGCRGRARDGSRVDRVGHGRLDSNSRRRVRRRGTQAVARRSADGWRRTALRDVRSRRADHAIGRRRGEHLGGARRPRASAHRSADAKRVTLGALDGYFTALLDADVRATFTRAVEHAAAPRASRSRRDRSSGTETIIDAYVNISLPEAAHWHAPTLDSRAADYQPPVRERLERGRTILAVNYLRGARHARRPATRGRRRARRMRRARAADAADRRARSRREPT